MSKGLDELKRLPKAIKDTFKDSFDIIEKELKDYYALKKECEEAKWYQEHKALEIITRVMELNVNWAKQLLEMGYLTQEEYELLDEVLL